MPRNRAHRGTLSALAVVALVTALAAGCGGDSATTYTKLSLAHSKCGRSDSSIGDRVQAVVNIKNRSGHDWEGTYLLMVGNSTFKLDGISLEGKAARYKGPEIWGVGPLDAGAGAAIRIQLTANKPGGSVIYFKPWGSSGYARVRRDDVPEKGSALNCRYEVG
jgi:hypothetical protein